MHWWASPGLVSNMRILAQILRMLPLSRILPAVHSYNQLLQCGSCYCLLLLFIIIVVVIVFIQFNQTLQCGCARRSTRSSRP